MIGVSGSDLARGVRQDEAWTLNTAKPMLFCICKSQFSLNASSTIQRSVPELAELSCGVNG